jgi:hypothetical protein
MATDTVAERETRASCADANAMEPVPGRGCETNGANWVGYESLKTSLGPGVARARHVAVADASTLRSIERGVFLVLAGRGSLSHGPHTLPPSFEMLGHLLAAVPPSIEIVVADKGCIAADLASMLHLHCDNRGDGETAWVRNGRILATTGFGFHPEKIQGNTSALEAAP